MNVINKYKQLLADMKQANLYNIFPYYDTEDIKDLEKLIDRMEKEDYNKEPVVACKHCKSLYIVQDELENNICFRCGSINDLKHFDNIEEYQKFADGNKE